MTKKRKPRLEAKADGTVGEFFLYGEIGPWYDSITARDVIKALDDMGDVDEITLRINSRGGEVFEGVAIYNAFRSHGAKVTTIVEGIAGSMAAVLVQCGAVRKIYDNAQFMVHSARGWTGGTANEIEQYLRLMRNVDETIKQIFAKRTGADSGTLDELLGKDSYLTAEEALDLGFFDEVIDGTEDTPEPAAIANRFVEPMDLAKATEHVRTLAAIAGHSLGGTTLMATATPNPDTVTPATPTGNATTPPNPDTPAADAPNTTPQATAAPNPSVAPEPVAAPAAPGPVKDSDHAVIVDLCVKCGCPEQAAAFIRSEAPLDQVRKVLLTGRLPTGP